MNTHLAVGSNNNHAYIWDLRSEELLADLWGHKGAIKGLCWNP